MNMANYSFRKLILTTGYFPGTNKVLMYTKFYLYTT